MKKKTKIYNEIKDKLTQQEKDAINAMFVIDDRYPKNLNEFQEKYGCDYEQTREVIRNILVKYETQIKKLQYTTHIFIDKNIWIKPGDIVEITIERSEREESENKSKAKKYNNWITYKHNNEQYLSFDFDIEEDFCADVQDYVEENIEQDVGITKYEIFDIQGDFLCESAKIRVIEIE